MSQGQNLPQEGSGDLDSAFEFGLDFGELRASTPKMEQQFGQSMLSENRAKPVDNVVLRIDNVPWVRGLDLFQLQFDLIHLRRTSRLLRLPDGSNSLSKEYMSCLTARGKL